MDCPEWIIDRRCDESIEGRRHGFERHDRSCPTVRPQKTSEFSLMPADIDDAVDAPALKDAQNVGSETRMNTGCGGPHAVHLEPENRKQGPEHKLGRAPKSDDQSCRMAGRIGRHTNDTPRP